MREYKYTSNNLFTPKLPNNYIRIPKEIILEKNLPEYRVSVFHYMINNQTREKAFHYSPVYMIQWCGYIPSWNRSYKNNIYEKFKHCMQWYFENGYIMNFEIDKYKRNLFQSSLLNEDKTNPKDNYGILFDFEIERIMEYESSYRSLNNSVLILLLSYIRSFTWTKIKPTGHSKSSKKRKPEIFHSQYKMIAEVLGMTERTVSKATDVLVDLGLIVTYRLPAYQNGNGKWCKGDILYVCPYKLLSVNNKIIISDDYDFREELEYGKKYVLNADYKQN